MTKSERITLWFLLSIAALWASVVVVSVAVLPAQGAALSQQQAMMLYTVAGGELGIGWPPKPPEIRIVPLEDLRAVVCPGKQCRMMGAFFDGVVYLRDDLDFSNPYHSSIVVHEMAHYIQWWKRGGNATTCEEFQRREDEAFAVQARVMQKAGHDTMQVLASATAVVCRQ